MLKHHTSVVLCSFVKQVHHNMTDGSNAHHDQSEICRAQIATMTKAADFFANAVSLPQAMQHEDMVWDTSSCPLSAVKVLMRMRMQHAAPGLAPTCHDTQSRLP